MSALLLLSAQTSPARQSSTRIVPGRGTVQAPANPGLRRIGPYGVVSRPPGDRLFPESGDTSCGSATLSFTQGDSIIGSIRLQTAEDVMLIVQFSAPPLSRVIASSVLKGADRVSSVQSAASTIRAEHAQFFSDLPQIEKRFQSMARPAPTITRFEYNNALNAVAITTKRWIGEEIQKLPYVIRVSPDERVEKFDDVSNAIIGAPQVWADYGVHGEDVDIGFIDTGIDYLHPEFDASPFPNAKVVGGYDLVNDDPDPMDDNGHGTHVASIAAGGGPLKGVAYKSRIWAFKVLDAEGFGYTSWVVGGMERALDPDSNPLTPSPIEVLNLSLGSIYGNAGDPLAQAVNNAVASGMITVVAAGNLGHGNPILGSPACAWNAVTVGATDLSDQLAPFSSSGPDWYTLGERAGIKPDILAPGMGIFGAKLGGDYIEFNGTSMATPHVAGAAALLRELHPGWPVGRIKAVLMETAKDIGESPWNQGGGRISIQDAASRKVVIEPASVHFGVDDPDQRLWIVQKTLTITNEDSIPWTFNFTADLGYNEGGISLSFDHPIITIPAEGSATLTATLEIDNAVFDWFSIGPERFTGAILATSTSPALTIRVPFSYLKAHLTRFIADETPWWLYFMGQYTILDTYWPVINDTFSVLTRYTYESTRGDILGTYWDRKTKIVVRDIPSFGIKTVRLQKSDAKNRIVVQPIDATGGPLLNYPLSFCQNLVSKQYSRGYTLTCGRFSGCPADTLWSPNELFVPDIDSTYTLGLSYLLKSDDDKLYYILFSKAGGIFSSDSILNDHSRFRRVDYTYRAPEGATSIDVGFNLWGEAGGNSVAVPAPFTLSAYYMPSPSPDLPWGWSTHRIRYDGTFNCYNSISTPKMAILPGDTFTFHHYLFDRDTVPISFVGKELTLKVGYGAPGWIGRMNNTAGTLRIVNPQRLEVCYGDNIFAHPLWGESIKPTTPFRLFPAGGGYTQGESDYGGEVVRPAAAGVNAFEEYDDQYKIMDVMGKATARMEFDTRRGDPNPPYLEDFQIYSRGIPSDELNDSDQTTIRWTLGDQTGIDSVLVFVQPLEGGPWTTMPFTRTGIQYVVDYSHPPFDGYTSLRIRAVDMHDNALDYRMEPAFFYNPAIPFPPSPILPEDGDTGQAAFITLKWTKPANAPQSVVTYHVQLATDSMFAALVLDDSGVTQPFRRVGMLERSKKYFWRVCGSNITGVGEYSGIRAFTTSQDTTMLITTWGTRWSLASLPVDPPNHSVGRVFPSASSGAYVFGPDGYRTEDSLRPGAGFWILFDRYDTVGVTGTLLESDTIPVVEGWNMVGSIGASIPVSLITCDPPGLTTSTFFGYSGSYAVSATIEPGQGYWVKVDRPGRLVFSTSPPLALASPRYINIVPTGEFPPSPPGDGGVVDQPVPITFGLSQNYPNPFNPTTTIAFDLPVDAVVSIRIFNTLGQEVMTLVDNEIRAAGRNEHVFDASGLPSGVYYYTIEARATASHWSRSGSARKMLLLR